MAFATAEDLAARRGRTFTETENAMAEFLLEGATAVIAEAASKNDAWAEALDPVPKILKLVCVEIAARVMPNPDGVASLQEQLGAYQHTERYRDAASEAGMFLSPTQELLVRRAVYGRTSGSVAVASIADELYGS